MIQITSFNNRVGHIELFVSWEERPNPAIIVDYTVYTGYNRTVAVERVYDGDSLESARHTFNVYTRALCNRAANKAKN